MRSLLTSNQSMPVVAQLGVDVGPLVVQHSEPVVQQHGRLRLGVTPAHRQLRPHAAQSGSTSSLSNTHCTDTRQQWRPTSRRPHIPCQTVSLFLVVVVLDRAHQIPLAVKGQCRPGTSGIEDLDCDPRRQLQILQSNADLGQAFAALESTAVFGTRVLKRDSSVNTVVLEQPIDDREVAVLSSPSDSAVVAGRRIDALVLQQSLDDREVAEISSMENGAVGVGRRIDALVLQ
jgi:hypothetical protein